MEICELRMTEYAQVLELLDSTPGVTLRRMDDTEAVALYLKRNPGLSFVAMSGREVVGCLLCGHDGRRGYLQHLIVKPDYRRQGIGTALVRCCIAALYDIGIAKAHVFVFTSNRTANSFWQNGGWNLRQEISMYSFNSSEDDNA